jgi:hypothetical protein
VNLESNERALLVYLNGEGRLYGKHWFGRATTFKAWHPPDGVLPPKTPARLCEKMKRLGLIEVDTFSPLIGTDGERYGSEVLYRLTRQGQAEAN